MKYLILCAAIVVSGCAAKQGYVTDKSLEDRAMGANLTMPTYDTGVKLSSSEAIRRAETGVEAYVSGKYGLARNLISSALSADIDDVPKEYVQRWVDTMLAMDWEEGKDINLLNAVDNLQFLSAADKSFWWCRVLERRGHLIDAKACWNQLGEIDRAKRVVSSMEYRDAFLPPYQQIGDR